MDETDALIAIFQVAGDVLAVLVDEVDRVDHFLLCDEPVKVLYCKYVKLNRIKQICITKLSGCTEVSLKTAKACEALRSLLKYGWKSLRATKLGPILDEMSLLNN